mmetsp:Transcript_22160/g.58753  ORF Transcript_22160/g.58753 Transcript_22160/m.58753 type:complete len:243 (-) Transcript_22160:310-1038(-)
MYNLSVWITGTSFFRNSSLDNSDSLSPSNDHFTLMGPSPVSRTVASCQSSPYFPSTTSPTSPAHGSAGGSTFSGSGFGCHVSSSPVASGSAGSSASTGGSGNFAKTDTTPASSLICIRRAPLFPKMNPFASSFGTSTKASRGPFSGRVSRSSVRPVRMAHVALRQSSAHGAPNSASLYLGLMRALPCSDTNKSASASVSNFFKRAESSSRNHAASSQSTSIKTESSHPSGTSSTGFSSCAFS